ncbi:hypothetical protein G9A89_008277 [Geosiphon pyriformis]|nr:hypothetical protein G9A89_008277 [Geosiphon pyriformis]
MSRSETCPSCQVLKLQLELKDSIIKAKDDKITHLSDSLIQVQKELIAAKEEALRGYRDLVHDDGDWEGEAEWISGSDNSSIRENRAYIGHVTDDISKAKLKRSLEEQFGRVLEIDMITTKHCAFATFASKDSYEKAVEQGLLFIDGKEMGIEEPKRRVDGINGLNADVIITHCGLITTPPFELPALWYPPVAGLILVTVLEYSLLILELSSSSFR